jgi:tetratricopeptide (TPR) repeat protein
MGRLAEALADHSQVLELAEGDLRGYTHIERGEIYHLIGRYKEALVELSQAVALGITNARPFALRGRTYRAVGCYPEALADFSQAIELEPDEEYYRYNRALTYQAMGQANAAQADLIVAICCVQQACGNDPQNWNSRFNLAICYIITEEFEEAEHLYRNALSSGASPYTIRGAIYDLA